MWFKARRRPRLVHSAGRPFPARARDNVGKDIQHPSRSRRWRRTSTGPAGYAGFAALAAVVACGAFLAQPNRFAFTQNPPPVTQAAQGMRQAHASVIDGDTLEIDGERFRLRGIDAPESRQSCRHDGRRWPCGRDSTRALENRIGAATVRCKGDGRDRYERVLAVCYADGTDLNAWMVRQGWALAYRRYSRDYVPEERWAKAARAGIWRGRFVQPWDWRRGQRLAQSAHQ
ncbi:thermonuclease family protein [Ferruginivarius sediminum]|nr:thermonuclease family protein [Ferruginivarius sediminum]